MNWVVALLLGISLGGAGIFTYLKLTSNKTLLNAQRNAKNFLEEARKEADTLKKEKLIEAEEENYDLRQKLEEEFIDKQNDLSRLEERLDQREVDIDRKAEVVNQKEDEIDIQEKELQEKGLFIQSKTEELNGLIAEEIRKLEEISGLTREEAKQVLLQDMEKEAIEEGQRIAHNHIEQAKLEANRKAREIVIQAIQQISPEQSVEATVSVITLPSDDMKGRIIGREGRNIRAFEMTTGVDVIIDDTPEIVVLSSYNSYRREIAKKALEKLISDGRIHPARIEEVMEKTAQEMQESLREIGEQTLLELGVHGVAEEIAEVLGKLQYRTSYGQNVLNHSIEVAHLCGIMAAELDLDVRLAKRAGILHDIGKGLDNSNEANHTSIGADFLRKFNEHKVVVNTAESHHNEKEMNSPITILVAACDKVSGTRPGARRESLEAFIKRMKELEEISNKFDGVNKSFAIQAGREIRVVAETGQIDDAQARELARKIAKEVQMSVEFPGQIKVTVIREYRAYSYAT